MIVAKIQTVAATATFVVKFAIVSACLATFVMKSVADGPLQVEMLACT